jgi:transposase
MNKNTNQEFIIPIQLLGIPNIVIHQTFLGKNNEIILHIESTEVGTTCGKCGKKVKAPHGHGAEIVLRHLPLCGHTLYLHIRPKRYECEICGSITNQKLPWYHQKSLHTRAYEDYLLLSLINSTVADVSIKAGLGYDEVKGVIDRRLESEVDWSEIDRLAIIGIDEISLKKGHADFVTVVTGRYDGNVLILGLLEGKEKDTVKAFLRRIPKRIRKHIKTVCTDMYDGFVNAAREVFPKKVNLVVDRFHVAKLYRGCVDKLRVKEIKRLKEELTEEEYKKLKGVMWILRKQEKDLTPEDKEILALLFKYSPDLRQAYQRSNELTAIFNSKLSRFHAKHKINCWIRRVQKRGLHCFDTFIKTLIKYKDPIANYFIDRNNSGFVEGFNNKLKAIKRRCYGILNINHFFQRVYLDTVGFDLFLPGTENQPVTP